MEKLKLSNNIIIVKFLLREVFNSVFNSVLLKSKTNKVIFLILLALAYITYIYINITQFNTFNKNFDNNIAKQLISKYINVTIITSLIIYLFIDVTFNLSSKSLFMLKSLPFSLKEINLSKSIFKLALFIILFELIIIITIPLFTLTNMNLIQFLSLFIIIHIIMLDCFLILEFLIQNILLKYLSNMLGYGLYISFIISSSAYYFVFFRFKIDLWVYYSSYSINSLLILCFIIFFMILLIMISILFKWFGDDRSFINLKYFNTKIKLTNGIFNIILLALLRQKRLVYMLSLVITATVLCFIYFDWFKSLQLLYFLYPLTFVAGLFYADSISGVSRMFTLYRVSTNQEFLCLVICQTLLLLPMTLLFGITKLSISFILIGFALITLTIILGFIFPAFESAINESTSSILTLFILVLISLLFSKTHYLILSITILLGVEYLCIFKERRHT